MAPITLRVFVSSPGDVGQERLLAARILERLQGEFGGYFDLQPILWEHEPLRATEHFQTQILRPSDADIVICILWSRLGTRLPERFHRPDGTTYASGTEWEFEDAATSFLNTGKPDLLVYRKTSEPAINFQDEDALQRLEQRKALDAFIDRWFGNPKEGFRAAFHAFEAPDEFENRLDIHLRKMLQERLPQHLAEEAEAATRITWFAGSPYRGLDAFDAAHAPVFFGRTRAIGAVKDALVRQASRGCAFVQIFGMSGGGKSSLMRAGVIPTITQPGVIEGVGLWRTSLFRPSSGGDDLFEGLAAALMTANALPELQTEGFDERAFGAELRAQPEAAVERLRSCLEQIAQKVAHEERLTHPPRSCLILGIDQMEELFTREQIDADTRTAFVHTLSVLAHSGLVWIVATMRSDFYPRCAELPELIAMKEGAGQYDLLPPTFAEIGQMIRYPSRAAGLKFEVDPNSRERLDDVLHETAAKDPEALPLLEFTLDELYRQAGSDRVLTFAAYESLGGLEGALTRRAEEVFTALPPSVQAELPAILSALVTMQEGEDSRPVSRAMPLASVASTPDRKRLVDAFVAARLLVVDRASDGEAVVRVAHEALLYHWPRVQTWLDADRDFLRVRARVADAATLWRREGQRADFLLAAGKPLAEAEDILHTRRAALDEQTAAYIVASHDRAVMARRTRSQRIATVVGAFCVVVLGFSFMSLRAAQIARNERGIALIQRQKAEQNAQLAQQQSSRALQEQQRAETEKTEANRQAKRALAASKLADTQKRRAQEQSRIAQQQRQVAEVQKLAAQRNYGHALAAADTMVSQLAQGIRPIAGTQSAKVKEILDSANGVYTTLLKDSETPDVLAGKGKMLNTFVDLYLRTGDSPRALASAKEAHALFARLVASTPTNAQYRSGLAASEEMLGSVYDIQGRYGQAEAELNAALALRERLAREVSNKTSPSPFEGEGRGGVEALRNLANCHYQLARIKAARGDRAGERQEFERALALSESVIRAAPQDLEGQRLFAMSCNSVAGSLNFPEDSAKAMTLYQQALDTLLRLTQHDPNNADLQRALASTYLQLGGMTQSTDTRRSREYYEAAGNLAERFTALDPNNADWTSLLLVSRNARADVADKTDAKSPPVEEQVRMLRALAARQQRLADADPANALQKVSLAMSQINLGLALMQQAQSSPSPADLNAQAMRCYRSAVDISRELSRRDATNKQAVNLGYLASMQMGLALGASRQPIDADRWFIQGCDRKIEWDRDLLKRFPADDDAWIDLAQTLSQQASLWDDLATKGIEVQAGKAKAISLYRAGVAAFERVARRQPRNEQALKGLSRNHLSLAVLLNAAGQKEASKAELAQKQSVDRRIRGGDSGITRINTDTGSRASQRTLQQFIEQARQMLHDLLPAAGALYKAVPTDANAKQLATSCANIADILASNPTRQNLADAQTALLFGIKVFQDLQADKKLTPEQIKSQQPLFDQLQDRLKRLPAADK